MILKGFPLRDEQGFLAKLYRNARPEAPKRVTIFREWPYSFQISFQIIKHSACIFE